MTTIHNEINKRICPVEKAKSLDNSLRRFLQNPRKILKPYIQKGMVVLDLGCGPGFFSIEIAKMLAGSGKVIAADIQQGMLDKVKQKIRGTELEETITLHLCESEKIGVTEKVDFVLAFYMIHEVPSKEKIFEELKMLIKPGGKIFIVEPMFHVSKKSFEDMLINLTNMNFEIIERPKMFFNRSALIGSR